MNQEPQAIIGIVLVGVIYFGLLFLAARKLNKGDAKKPVYGSKYTEALVNSNGFRHGSLSD